MYASALASVLAWWWIDEGNFIGATLFYLLCSTVSQINTPILWSSITEAAEYGYYKTGIDASGLGIGMISFCQKLGMGIAGPITGYLLDYVGYQAQGDISATAVQGLSTIMLLVPALFYLLTGWILKGYFINNVYYVEMVSAKRLPGTV